MWKLRVVKCFVLGLPSKSFLERRAKIGLYIFIYTSQNVTHFQKLAKHSTKIFSCVQIHIT